MVDACTGHRISKTRRACLCQTSETQPLAVPDLLPLNDPRSFALAQTPHQGAMAPTGLPFHPPWPSSGPRTYNRNGPMSITGKPTPGPALLTPNDHALVLIDFQSQMAFATKRLVDVGVDRRPVAVGAGAGLRG